MFRLFFLSLCAGLLASCAATEDVLHTRPVPIVGIEGRWVGDVTPSDPKVCGPTRHGVLVIGSGEFAFDPFSSTITLNGKVGPADTLQATLERPAGGGGKVLRLSFNAEAKTDPAGTRTISGTLVSGDCIWQVALRRG